MVRLYTIYGTKYCLIKQDTSDLTKSFHAPNIFFIVYPGAL